MHSDLRLRIAVVVASMLVFTNALTAALFYARFHDELETHALGAIRHDADVVAGPIQRLAHAMRRDVAIVARTRPAEGVGRARSAGGVDPEDGSTYEQWRERLETIFESVMRGQPHYDQLRYLALTEGAPELIRVDRHGPGGSLRRVSADELQNKGTEAYVRDFLASPSPAIRMGRIDLNREQGRLEEPLRPVQRVVHPMYLEGRPVGIIVINADLGPTFERMLSNRPPTSRLLLTDEDGEVLVASDDTPTFATARGLDAPAESTPDLVRTLHRGHRDVTGVVEGSVHLVRRLGENDTPPTWLSLEVPAQSVGSPADEAARAAMWLAIAALVVCVLLVVYVTRRMIAPVRAVAEQVRTLNVAENVAPLPLPKEGEARMVAEAFNAALARLEASRRQLRRSNEELAEVAAIASHDLAEPARTVHSFSTALSERYADRLDDSGRQMLGFLTDASSRMLALVRSVLDHARLGTRATLESIDLDALVRSVLEDLAPAIREADADVRVLTPLPTLHAQPVEIRLVLQNLVANALKFRDPARPLVVEIGAERLDRGVRGWVSDNGLGVAPERAAGLFRMFAREHGREVPGVGMGLAHCRKIVEQHNGHIAFDLDVPRGSKVVFELPDG